MLDFLAPVPMDDWVLWVVGIGFFLFAVALNVFTLPRGQAETRHNQGRFHWIAYGVIGLLVLMAVGVM